MTDYQVRIPNLPLDKIVDEDGRASPTEITFRQTLVSNLQKYFGNEGCVVPTQSLANMTLIQNNGVIDPSTNELVYSCQLGTILYVIVDPTDYTQDKVVIAVRNDNTYPATPPVFKQVTLT